MKCQTDIPLKLSAWSSSPRRAWIEIVFISNHLLEVKSSSPRRAWIEIVYKLGGKRRKPSSSPRRAWIEIDLELHKLEEAAVVLPTEGVD